jgi:hypothetical protein
LDNMTRGERLMMVWRLGGGQHEDNRRGAEDTMWGYWAADVTTRGGGVQCTQVVKRVGA